MAAAVPTSAPLQFSAGDSVTWQITLPDYPAPTYSLAYYLTDGTHKIGPIASAASGTDHLITIATTTSEEYEPGTYSFKCFALKTGERWEVDSGIIEILPDFVASAAGAIDPRSEAKQQLDAIEANIKRLLSRQLASYTTAGGTFTLANITSLYAIRDRLKSQYLAESGKGGARHLRARFTTPISAITPGTLWP